MTVVLGHTGIQQLIKSFEIKSNMLDSVVELVKLRLAQEGYEVLLEHAPTHDLDGNRKGSASIESMPKGYRVCYKGEDVAYIEFGTGYMGESSFYSDSSTLAKIGWNYDVNGHGVKGWWYVGKKDGLSHHSLGMRAEMPIYKSYMELRNRVREIIIEVFNGEFK